MDIRKQTVIIIRKDGEYLVGRSILGELRWSVSPWDAWKTRKRDKAFIVADRVDGVRFLFNPVAGPLRQMKI